MHTKITYTDKKTMKQLSMTKLYDGSIQVEIGYQSVTIPEIDLLGLVSEVGKAECTTSVPKKEYGAEQDYGKEGYVPPYTREGLEICAEQNAKGEWVTKKVPQPKPGEVMVTEETNGLTGGTKYEHA